MFKQILWSQFLSQVFPRFLSNLPVNYRPQKRQPLIPILSQMDPFDNPNFSIISDLRVGLPSGLFPSGCSVKSQFPLQQVPRDFPHGYSGREMKLTAHLYLLPRIRMRAAIPPLPIVVCLHSRGAPKGGAVALQPPKPPKNRNFKISDFVDIIISRVLRDLPFSRNQPLKSTDDQYIRILKNKLIELKKKQEDGTL